VNACRATAWSMCVPISVLIAQAIFLLEHVYTDIPTRAHVSKVTNATDHPTMPPAMPAWVVKSLMKLGIDCMM